MIDATDTADTTDTPVVRPGWLMYVAAWTVAAAIGNVILIAMWLADLI